MGIQRHTLFMGLCIIDKTIVYLHGNSIFNYQIQKMMSFLFFFLSYVTNIEQPTDEMARGFLHSKTVGL